MEVLLQNFDKAAESAQFQFRPDQYTWSDVNSDGSIDLSVDCKVTFSDAFSSEMALTLSVTEKFLKKLKFEDICISVVESSFSGGNEKRLLERTGILSEFRAFANQFMIKNHVYDPLGTPLDNYVLQLRAA